MRIVFAAGVLGLSFFSCAPLIQPGSQLDMATDSNSPSPKAQVPPAPSDNLYLQSTPNSTLYLKNGSIIIGSVVEIIPTEVVKFRTRDGTLFVFKIDEVLKIEEAAKPREPNRISGLQNARVENPYTTRRKMASWGLASVQAATLLGASGMGDKYFSTTVIPIVGPWITILRVEDDPTASYLPGGKPLLMASGVAQAGFLTYLISSWDSEKSYQQGIAVQPIPNMLGLSMAYRF